MTITNTKLIHNRADYGGAICNEGTLNITDSTFSNNTAYYGGAIRNYGSLTLTNTTFNNNTANNGGAIYNEEGTLNITDSTFNNNTAKQDGGAINNRGTLNITNTTFNNNTAKQGGAINNNKIFIIYNCTFKKNFASENYTQDICNYGRLFIIKLHFSSTDKTILNKGSIRIYNESKSIEENIYNDGGAIFLLEKLTENEKNFTYLDQLIHNGQKEIQLKEDIILEEGEEDKFIYGITIDENDIIIDGNGHTIDAKGDKIFNLTGNNITIKNIKIVNGYSNDGGAISNSGTLNITNTTFNNNMAENDGGAIYSYGN